MQGRLENDPAYLIYVVVPARRPNGRDSCSNAKTCISIISLWPPVFAPGPAADPFLAGDIKLANLQFGFGATIENSVEGIAKVAHTGRPRNPKNRSPTCPPSLPAVATLTPVVEKERVEPLCQVRAQPRGGAKDHVFSMRPVLGRAAAQ